MAWLGIAVYLILTAPVRAGAILHWADGLPRFTVGVMVWGLRAKTELRLSRNEEGRLLLAAAFRDRPIPLPRRSPGGTRALKILGLMLKSGGRGAALRGLVKVRALEATVRVGGQNAAAMAVAVGLLRIVAAVLPVVRLRVLPALGAKSGVHARCITETRLGILVAAVLLWLLSQRRAARKEEKPWIVPSEA